MASGSAQARHLTAWSLQLDPVVLLALVAGAILAFLALYPTVMLFVGSFSDAPLGVAGRFTLANYVRAYGDPHTYRLIGTSFVFATGASLFSVALAGLLAWITVRTNARWGCSR